MTQRRLPQHLTLKGVRIEDTDLIAHCRLAVHVRGAYYQETGPLLALRIPTCDLLAEEITEALEWAHERRVQRSLEAQRVRLETEQPGLFPVPGLPG